MRVVFVLLAACGGGAVGGPVQGVADTHCEGVTPQVVDPAVCGDNTAPVTASDYGLTRNGTVADDDDCKYHVSWSSTPIRENSNVTFTVQAAYLAAPGGPVVGLDTANAYAEAFLSDTHPAPPTTQVVSEPMPGTITFAPIQFDQKGTWTVRFHFFENCSDGNEASPHGHTAFHVEVP